ncbi:putative endonuclease [Curvibacter phage P26059A]|nr:putative endonuclease [Curvibacter phage P26059A]
MNTMIKFNTRFEAGKYLRNHSLKHHIYMLMDGDTPIYVGVSNNWKRVYEHFNIHAKRVNVLLRRKMRKMLREGREVTICIVGHFHSRIELEHGERSLIMLYGKKIDRLGVLCNLSDGGEGTRLPRTQKQKDAVSAANKGRVKSAETRKRISEAQKLSYEQGRKPSFLGKKHTEESKRLLSESQKGEKSKYFNVTGEAHFNYGKRRTDEQKRNIAAGQDPEKLQWDAERKEQLREYWDSQPVLTCPHCGKQSSFKAAMVRHHFDSCKSK